MYRTAGSYNHGQNEPFSNTFFIALSYVVIIIVGGCIHPFYSFILLPHFIHLLTILSVAFSLTTPTSCHSKYFSSNSC